MNISTGDGGRVERIFNIEEGRNFILCTYCAYLLGYRIVSLILSIILKSTYESVCQIDILTILSNLKKTTKCVASELQKCQS